MLPDEIIQYISSRNSEPEWLLTWRLKAYEHWSRENDLKKDPSEMNNVYNDPKHKSIQKSLHIKLAELRKFYGDSDSLNKFHINSYLSKMNN